MSPLPGIILAAGLSRRMEGKCKLLLPFRGRAMVAHAARAALDGGLNPVVLVVGPHSPSEVAQACLKEASAENGRIRVATAERAAMGQAESLKAGLTFMRKLAPDAPGVMVLLGDLPLVDGDLVQRLASAFLAAYHEQNAPFCVVPRAEREGRRGNPAVLHAGLFADVQRCGGAPHHRCTSASGDTVRRRRLPCRRGHARGLRRAAGTDRRAGRHGAAPEPKLTARWGILCHPARILLLS